MLTLEHSPFATVDMVVRIISWKVKLCMESHWHEYLLAYVGDTYLHSWEVLAEIIKCDEAKDMILDIGM